MTIMSFMHVLISKNYKYVIGQYPIENLAYGMYNLYI